MVLFEGLKAAAKDTTCFLLRNNAHLLKVLTGGGVVLRNASGYNTARFLWEVLCNEPYPEPPISPPFAGGQCPVIYFVTVRWTAPSLIPGVGDYDDTSFNPVGGPIYGLSITPGFQGPDSRWEMGIDATDPNTGERLYYTSRSIDRLTWGQPTGTIISIVREDGLPDDCGDRGDLLPPDEPLPPPAPIDITYIDNDNNINVISGFLILGFAYIDADLNVKIPVTINVPVNINPSFDVGFDIDAEFNLGDNTFKINPPRPPGSDPTPPPGRPPDDDPRAPRPTDPPPPPDPDVPNPPPPPEEDPPERVIRGVLVTVTDDSDASTVGGLAQDNNPDIAIPNYGYINFFSRLSSGAGGWSPDFPVKNARTLITCPWPGGAQVVEGTPRLGVQWVLTPIYGPGGFLGAG